MGFPYNVTIAKCHPFRGDNFYITSFGSDRTGTEYVRRDPAVLAELPEVKALVAVAVTDAATWLNTRIWFAPDALNQAETKAWLDGCKTVVLHSVDGIRLLIPADANASLDAHVATAVMDALERAADLIDAKHRGDLPKHIVSEEGNMIRAMIQKDADDA